MVTSRLNITTTRAMELTPSIVHLGAAIRAYGINHKTTLAKPTDLTNHLAARFHFLNATSVILVS